MLENFRRDSFSYEGESFPIWRIGEGPAVLLLAENPGLSPQALRLAERIAARGMHVILPELFGTTGKPFSLGYAVTGLAKICIRKEFHILAANQTSPITTWLRALAREMYAQQQGAGVGVIGMCLSGNFALSLMLEPAVIAPVMSQPGMPFAMTKKLGAALHIADEDLATIKERCLREDRKVLALSFSEDLLCPKARIETLKNSLGDIVEHIEIDSSPKNPHGIKRTAHSVLTLDLVDQEGHPTQAALLRVLGFLQETLCPELTHA